MKTPRKNKRFDRYQLIDIDGHSVTVANATDAQIRNELCNLMDLVNKIKSKSLDSLSDIENYGY